MKSLIKAALLGAMVLTAPMTAPTMAFAGGPTEVTQVSAASIRVNGLTFRVKVTTRDGVGTITVRSSDGSLRTRVVRANVSKKLHALLDGGKMSDANIRRISSYFPS